MTNPSSRLTKFRLTLEEYDFTITYIKGKDNVTADALSRIQIESDELKSLNSKTGANINVLTRAQRKIEDAKENSNYSNLEDRPDHPGIVELLERPEESVELKIVNEKEFKAMLQRNSRDYYYNKRNIVYDRNASIIFLKQDSRSLSTLSLLVRDLIFMCKKYKIPELVIIKNEECALILQEILKIPNEIKNSGLKITIIKSVKIITDKETQNLLINDFHMLPTGGHAGINRMYNSIKRRYYWSGLRRDIEKFVKRCDDCQRYKHSKPHKEPMAITSTAISAMQKVFLDLVGPLEQDEEDNRYILTLQCELTKFVECYPITNKEAATVAKAFVENFILRYGIPREIATDQGTEFLATTFKETCKLLKIKQLNSTAHHHETLGALENSHKNLGAYLRMQIANHGSTWSSWVPYWCFAYNNTIHTETCYTPFELVFGKASCLPSNLACQIDPVYNFDDYPKELKYRLQVAWNDARENLITSKINRKISWDKKQNSIYVKIGDKVLLRNNNSGNKLDPIYKGPYEVREIKGQNLVIKIDKKLVEVHKNRTKLYYS